MRYEHHGMSNTPEYTSWSHMHSRCLDRYSSNYHNYGGRGITICPEWIDSFKQFFVDMGPRPKGMSIQRIDNDLGYFPTNCKWASVDEQRVNRRSCGRVLVHNGMTMDVTVRSSFFGINNSPFNFILLFII